MTIRGKGEGRAFFNIYVLLTAFINAGESEGINVSFQLLVRSPMTGDGTVAFANWDEAPAN